MNVLSARVALRERGFLDIVDLTLRFLVAHAKIYLRLAAFALVPIAAATTYLVQGLEPILGWSILVAVGFFVQVPFTILAGRLVFADDVRVREVLRDSLRVFFRALGLRILQVVAIVIGSFTCIVPGLWLAVIWFFANEVLVLEGSRPTATLGRAKRLVDRRFGEAVVALIGLIVLQVAIVLAFESSARVVASELLQLPTPESPWKTGAPTILAAIGFWLFVPFGTTARFFVYLDLRTRSEAWDVQTKFAALAARLKPEAST